MTIPMLPFDEFGIILTTMGTSIQMLYFIVLILINGLGILVSDIIIDKRLKTEYEYEWKEVILLALSSGIITMGILEIYATTFWMSCSLAWILGLIFRPLLPELAKLMQDKARILINNKI